MPDPGEDRVASGTQPLEEPHPLDPIRHTPLELDRASGPVLLVGTRKGAWVLRADASRAAWEIAGPVFLGHIVNHFVLDPRDHRTMLMAVRTGHLGPTVFRSNDLGKTWRPRWLVRQTNGLVIGPSSRTVFVRPTSTVANCTWSL